MHAPCLPARHCSTTMPFDSSSCSPWPCCGMVSPPVAAACAVISRSLGCAPPSSATGSARWRQHPGGPAASMTQTVQRLAVATGAAASCSADVQGLARVAGAEAPSGGTAGRLVPTAEPAGRAATSLFTALEHVSRTYTSSKQRPTTHLRCRAIGGLFGASCTPHRCVFASWRVPKYLTNI